MPSRSAKQARFMAACSHGAKYSSCPPSKVSHEFNQADKGTGVFKKADGGLAKLRTRYRGSKPATPEDELTVSEGAPTPKLKALRAAAGTLTGNEKHEYLPRALRSLVTQFATLGPDGQPALPGIHGKSVDQPGLVDSALSLPELGPLLGQLLVAADQKWPSTTPLKNLDFGFEKLANWDTPQWSKDAAERYSRLDTATRTGMGLSRPRGFGEHAADSLGVMAGQIPLIGGVREAGTAAKGVRRVLGAVPEYLGPTITPSVGAYSSGTIGGGALGVLGDPDQGAESNVTHWSKGGYMSKTLGQLRNKYADGGKVGKSAEAVKAIKNAMSHLANRDNQSAVSALQSNKEAASDPNVKAAIGDLMKAKQNSAAQRLNRILESDSNVNAMPMLAKGGKVGAVTAGTQKMIDSLKALGHSDEEALVIAKAAKAKDSVMRSRATRHHGVDADIDSDFNDDYPPFDKADGGSVSFDDYVSSLLG